MENDVGVSISEHVKHIENRVQKTAGIRLMPPDEAMQKGYFPGAALPREGWEPVGLSLEIEHGTGCLLRSPHSQVGVVHVGTEHTAELAEIVLHNNKSPHPDLEKQNRLTLALEKHLAGVFFEDDGNQYRHGVIGKGPGLETVTVDSRSGLKPGMHLDSWDGNASRAEDTRIRVNVNLGPEPRYFLFFGKSMAQIQREVENGTFVPEGANTLYYQYLASHQASPIFRIKVMPGEAYVAATDCIIHDGSTLGSTAEVYTLQVRGKLKSHAFGLPV